MTKATCTLIQHEWPEPLVLGDPLDLVFADPPYNYGVDYADDPTRDRVKDYWGLTEATILRLVACLRPGGTLWWLCPAEHGDAVWSILLRHGRLLQDRPIIWHERFAQYQQGRLTSDYRLLFPLVVPPKDRCTFFPDAIRERSERQRMGDKRADPRGRVPGHVWASEELDIFHKLSPELQDRVVLELGAAGHVWRTRRLQGTARDRVGWHPAQLPPEPLRRIVLGWTSPGDRVMDAFVGSGSLGRVALAAGRDFVGVDRSPTYLTRVKERLMKECQCTMTTLPCSAGTPSRS